MFNNIRKFSRTDKLIIISGMIGNFLEAFEIMICVFLAKEISRTFLSPNSSVINLYYTFGIFMIGYLAKPIGGLLIGLYADQVGRKKLLIFSILISGVSTVMIGLIPSYQSIGAASTLLFILFRIFQNAGLGGEYISSISYLIENAKPNKKGFYGSWVSAGLNSGTLLASLVAFIMIYFIDRKLLPEWGWRLAFISSSIGLFFGFKIRSSLPESLGFMLENSGTKLNQKMDIFKSSLAFIKKHPYQCLSVAGITWLGVSETFSIFIYSPILMSTINHLSQNEAMGINSISLFLLITLIPFFGFLSDYFNRIKLLILTSISFIILSFPYFFCISHGNYLQILIVKLIFSIASACFYAIAPTLMTEIFPLNQRCTILAILYQSIACIAGGLSPIILLYLSHLTEKHASQVYSPANYLILSSLIGIIGLYLLKKKDNVYTISSKTEQPALSYDNT